MKFKYENVLLERRDVYLSVRSETLPVMVDHDVARKVGDCVNIRITEEGIFGDIESIEDVSGLYPSIGYRIIKWENGEGVEGVIHNIGVSVKENLDPNIGVLMGSTATNH